MLMTHPSALLAPLALSFVALSTFLVLYWHYEARYFQLYAPFVAIFAAVAVFWLHDHLTIPRPLPLTTPQVEEKWRLLFLPVVLVLLLYAPVRDQLEAAPKLAGATPLVWAAQWFEQNTSADAVILSREPWQFNFHSRRPALMIPYNDEPTIRHVAAYYKASYLHMEGTAATYRPALKDLYNTSYAVGSEPRPGYELIYNNGYELIYRLK